MKNERRLLIIKVISCEHQIFSIYFIIRGVKGLEHFALMKGGLTDAINYVKRNKLMDEVHEIIDLSKETIPPKTVRKYIKFINNIISKTHRLICFELTTNNLGDRDG